MRDILLKIIDALQEFVPPTPAPESTPESSPATDTREVVEETIEEPEDAPVTRKRSGKK